MSGIWGSFNLKKDNLYNSGEIVLYESNCGDYTCVYVAKHDVPAIFNSPPPFLPQYWELMYCVENGKPNKCEKRVECGPGRAVVDLGEDNLICVPVESRVGG